MLILGSIVKLMRIFEIFFTFCESRKFGSNLLWRVTLGKHQRRISLKWLRLIFWPTQLTNQNCLITNLFNFELFWDFSVILSARSFLEGLPGVSEAIPGAHEALLGAYKALWWVWGPSRCCISCFWGFLRYVRGLFNSLTAFETLPSAFKSFSD